MPQKQCMLHGVQGKTADPGFIVHWTYPHALSKESKWLAYYVSLSRPRSFKKLLSHGLPDREIIEEGPPKDILTAYNQLFMAKITKTKIVCVATRKKLGWPARMNSWGPLQMVSDAESTKLWFLQDISISDNNGEVPKASIHYTCTAMAHPVSIQYPSSIQYYDYTTTTRTRNGSKVSGI